MPDGYQETGQAGFDDLMARLEEKGLMEIYRVRSGEILPPYFSDPYGIHGIAHARRVLMLSLILASLNNLSREDMEILILASFYHDIGRTHNGTCFEHGRKSFIKMAGLGLAGAERGEDSEILRYVIENHCVDDREGYQSAGKYHFGNKDRAIGLLKLFKDCDNLDRVRLGDLNTSYLRNRHSPGLVKVAERLLREIS